MYDILLVGDYFFDIIYCGLPEFPSLGREIVSTSITSTGGAMYITACALRRLGANVAWLGNFGNDPYSEFVAGLARDEGIDLALARQLDQPYRQVTTSMPFQGERAFVTYADEEPADNYAYWLDVARETEFRHLHFGGLKARTEIAALVEAAHTQGATVSMDCHDTPHLHREGDWREELGGIDILLANAREARAMTRLDDVQAAAAQVSRWVGKAIVKDGAFGSWVAVGGEVTHVGAVCAGDVIDTTGAGDCFNAGYLFGRITQGVPDMVAAKYGNICGGLSVTGIGGATAAPTYTTLMKWVRRCEAMEAEEQFRAMSNEQ